MRMCNVLRGACIAANCNGIWRCIARVGLLHKQRIVAAERHCQEWLVESSQGARCVTMRMCNVSRGACIAANCNGIWRCIARVGRRAQSKMWEFEVLMQDSGMSGVFSGYSSKNRDGW